MIRWIFLSILAGALWEVGGMLLGAESNLPTSYVATVQGVLRQEKLYPGEIDGVFATETIAAIRRYQIVHGLRVTGRLDDPTLAAMHLQPPPAPSSVAEEDRKFLRQQLATSAPRIVGEAPSKPKLRATPTPSPTPVSQEVIRQFLEKYLDAASRRDITAEMAFFSPVVDYLDKGNLNRDALQMALRRSRMDRPKRFYEFAGIRTVLAATPDNPSTVVRFAVRFRPANHKKRAGGIEGWEAGIVSDPQGSLKIASLHQRTPP